MSATDTPRHGVAFDRDAVSGANLLFVDMRVRSLLAREARHRSLTRVFGVPPDEQSLLVTMILVGAAVAVLRDLVPRPWPRPSGADAAVGGALLNTTIRGIAGAPSRTVPFAGALIGLAVVSHSLRPAVMGTAHELRGLAHGVRAAFGARYGS